MCVMELDPELTAYAQQTQLSYSGHVLEMWLASDAPVDRLLAKARVALDRIRGSEVHWDVRSETDGVVISMWGFVADIDQALKDLARALDSDGVKGRLEQRAPPAKKSRPSLHQSRQELIECHIRPRGQRHRLPSLSDARQRAYRREEEFRTQLVLDTDALLAAVNAGLAWVSRPPAGAQLCSSYGAHETADEISPFIAAFVEERTRWLLEHRPRPAESITEVALSERNYRLQFHASAWWEAEERFRLMVISGLGNLSLVEGGKQLGDGAWRPSFQACMSALKAAKDWAVRAIGRSLASDWVAAPHVAGYLEHFIYEDVLVPDAFGAQLLGPGYAARLPSGLDWEIEDLGDDACLVVHREPELWFGKPLGSPSADGSKFPGLVAEIPEFMIRAREDFAPILITEEILTRRPLDPLAGT
jgi:hypothetical protein